jgi:hypothetical protein
LGANTDNGGPLGPRLALPGPSRSCDNSLYGFKGAPQRAARLAARHRARTGGRACATAESGRIAPDGNPSHQRRAAAGRHAEPDARPAGRTAIRSKPVRITLDLSPELYRELTGWADSAAVALGVPRVSLADAVRAMIWLTADNPDQVLDRLRRDRDR